MLLDLHGAAGSQNGHRRSVHAESLRGSVFRAMDIDMCGQLEGPDMFEQSKSLPGGWNENIVTASGEHHSGQCMKKPRWLRPACYRMAPFRVWGSVAERERL